MKILKQPLYYLSKKNNEILEFSLIPQKKLLKLLPGTEKEINYLGMNLIIEPIVGKVLQDSPASVAGVKNNDKILA